MIQIAMTNYLEEAQSLFKYLCDLRRDFHRHPELGFQEVRTAGIVASELSALDLEVSTGVAETGVVAMIEGSQPGPIVLLRFDMDALPILEETGAEYASQNPGMMHACGHDGHTAIGLAVARLLHAHRAELAGGVKLVFQPAEEGLGGAERMVAEGVLQNPQPDFALALHLWNNMPFGWIGLNSGPIMAAGEEFIIRITGRGGHGALPHLTADPVLASAQIITSLQSIVSRNVSPLQTAVVSVTSLHGGEAFNVIPPVIEMRGTIRTFEPDVRELVLERFNRLVETVASAFNCRAEIDVCSITPAVVNNPRVAAHVQSVVTEILPSIHLNTDFRTMVSEDMAFMMRDIPGCYFLVGSANSERGLDAPHHHPRFDFDENALPRAAGLMATVAARLLSK